MKAHAGDEHEACNTPQAQTHADSRNVLIMLLLILRHPRDEHSQLPGLPKSGIGEVLSCQDLVQEILQMRAVHGTHQNACVGSY